MQMDIHIATTEEMTQANMLSYQTWAQGQSVEEYLQESGRSWQENDAQCWVLTVDKKVVASVGAHRMAFYADGTEISGFGMAALHTDASLRRNGYGQMLVEHARPRIAEQFGDACLIFSAIKSEYYEKMGFILHSNISYDCFDLEGLTQPKIPVEFRKIQPHLNIDWLEQLYAKQHKHCTLAVARNKEYWEASLRTNVQDQFCVMVYRGKKIGYLRYHDTASYSTLVECVVEQEYDVDRKEMFVASAYRYMALMAIGKQLPVVTSWQRPPPSILPFFSARKRNNMSPMLWLSDSWMPRKQSILESMPVYASDYF